ncbi:MAG: HIT domain-containing protein [Pirellulales bacterium]
MDEQRLWAPWRLAYVQGQGDVPTTEDDVERRWADGADHDCFICRVAAESRDRENLLVVRRPEAVCILNRFPYNNGHLLIAPLTHKGRIDELDDDEHLALMRLVTRAARILADTMHAEGFNVGLNLGRVAGRTARPSPLARRAPLVRRRQLHARHGRHPRHPPSARRTLATAFDDAGRRLCGPTIVIAAAACTCLRTSGAKP